MTEDLTLWTQPAGAVTVVIRRYMLGQYRIQIELDEGWSFPSILCPEC